MAVLGVGSRKVWLDPTKKHLIAEARSRESIRDLIAQDVVRLKPGHRGHRSHIDNVLRHNHRRLRRIKEDFAIKQRSLFGEVPSKSEKAD